MDTRRAYENLSYFIGINDMFRFALHNLLSKPDDASDFHSLLLLLVSSCEFLSWVADIFAALGFAGIVAPAVVPLALAPTSSRCPSGGQVCCERNCSLFIPWPSDHETI